MSKREDLVKFHKKSIAEAAERLFEKQGLEQTTMDQVAREAEYSKATIYVYFKSKEEIYYYIVLNGMQKMMCRMENGLNSCEEVTGKYKAVCHELAGFSEEHPFQYKALTDTIAVDLESRKRMPVLEEIYQIGEEMNDIFNDAFQEAAVQGSCRDDLNSLTTTMVLWSSLSGIIRLANEKEEYLTQRMNLSKAEFLDDAFDMLLRIIIKEEVADEEKNN